jgi:hypothetical protein
MFTLMTAKISRPRKLAMTEIVSTGVRLAFARKPSMNCDAALFPIS